MRSAAIAALVLCLVAGVGFVFARDLPPPGTPAATGSEAASFGEAADAGEAEGADAPPADARKDAAKSSGGTTYYQWVDDRGSVRFARSLAEVPPAWRDRAGQVSVDSSDLIRPDRPARRAGRAHAAREEPARRASHDVTIYTAPWCGWCRKTMAFLDERGVDYVNKDIDEDPDNKAELIERSGGSSIPVTDVDGTLVRGYNPHELTALLE